MATQAPATNRKARRARPPPTPSAGTHPQLYRRRRPETTTLHRIVREHLETCLALANESDPMGNGVTDHVEKELRSYLKCGILTHGFARARCSECGHDFLVAFSCKGRGACPSCNAKRMAETAAHLVDHVFPPVPVRQWVLSVPKRLRFFLHRHGLLEPHETEDMLILRHGGGFSLDASVRIEATDRTGLERLIRCCARGPFALDRRSDQILSLPS